VVSAGTKRRKCSAVESFWRAMAQFPFCGHCMPTRALSLPLEQPTARCLSQSADIRITFLHQQQWRRRRRTSEGINWWGYAASLISHTRRVKPSSAIFALPIMFRSASAVFINCSRAASHSPPPRICHPKIFSKAARCKNFWLFAFHISSRVALSLSPKRFFASQPERKPENAFCQIYIFASRLNSCIWVVSFYPT
jgi:hypothetical protein